MRLLASVSLAFALAACGPPAPVCSTTTPCPSGQLCQAGQCVAAPDAGQGACLGPSHAGPPPNLLDNPSFECGAPTGWFAVGGELGVEEGNARHGGRSARLSAPNGGAAVSLWHERDAVGAPGQRTYCVRAWMRGTAKNGRITLRKVTSGGGVDENFSSPLTADWVLVPPPSYGPLKVTAANEDRFLLRVWIPNAAAGEVLVVDDAQLWESASGQCNER